MTYEDAFAFIHGLEGRGWRLGLDRMRAFVERAGLSEAIENKGFIHIAGTNGKGSTTALVESILRGQGWRSGAFFSPYVIDYRERIQAEGRLIEPEELVRLVEEILPAAESMSETEFGGITKFELEAALGFAYWERKRCEWVALEVGLGGRLDATNVVSPRACAIVSISLDHTSILGNSLEEIALEKAGIVKPGIPLIIGDVPAAAATVIEGVAQGLKTPVWRLGREVKLFGDVVETPVGIFEGICPGLRGVAMPHNAAVAVAACAAAGAIRNVSTLSESVQKAWLPGRFDVRNVEGVDVIFDGAHNADAARLLVQSLKAGPVRLVTNMLAGHEARPFYEPFRGIAVGAEIAPIDFSRAIPVADARRMIEEAGIPARGHATVREALHAAVAAGDAQVVVCGSNYLVGEALRLAD